MGDWYGAASATTMVLGNWVRAYLVAQTRNAVDKAATDTSIYTDDIVRALVVLATGKAATVLAPRNVVVNCFLSPPKVAYPIHYSVARFIGWFAFAGFVVTIGQAIWMVQMAIVITTVSATVMTAFAIGTEKECVGKTLQVARLEHPNQKGKCGEAYANLHLSKEEEETMILWSLFPQKQNKEWWDQYRRYRSVRGKAITIYGNSPDSEKKQPSPGSK